ncbi:hypothetical protein OG539_33960 [Actinacidiphila glaucinigra]|uniref:sodium:solute symporter family transporter n=1 Tax=Actinacidiphila glaucinigra TaxID=235986 RepID=UPI002DDB54A6|nr:hypothetical protein [Actinacidiphila glaucinigra]WSD59100.1 hypothetical protein OIE69_09365 [Actinacidiphila glaucinigra]
MTYYGDTWHHWQPPPPAAAPSTGETLLSSVSGLTLAAASSLAHDLFGHAMRDGLAAARTEPAVARWAAVGVGATAVALAALVQDQNVAVITTTAPAIGASAVAPALTYSLFWRGLGRTGLLAALYGGTGCVLLLTVFSTPVPGGPTALFPDRDFHWFPPQTAGLLSVPFGFLAGRLGSRYDRRRRDGTAAESGRRYEAGEARLLAGAG